MRCCPPGASGAAGDIAEIVLRGQRSPNRRDGFDDQLDHGVSIGGTKDASVRVAVCIRAAIVDYGHAPSVCAGELDVDRLSSAVEQLRVSDRQYCAGVMNRSSGPAPQLR